LTGSQQRLDGTAETLITHSLRADGFDASDDGTGRGTPLVACTLPASNGGVSSGFHPVIPSVEFGWNKSASQTMKIGETCDALQASPTSNPAVAKSSSVRRLTPRECERLQGFPDDWTLVPYRDNPAKDGPRYKAIGNSMAVPVVRWIGRRILESMT